MSSTSQMIKGKTKSIRERVFPAVIPYIVPWSKLELAKKPKISTLIRLNFQLFFGVSKPKQDQRNL